jgi:hypothetical protein
VNQVVALDLIGRICLHLIHDRENLLMHEAYEAVLLIGGLCVHGRTFPLKLNVLLVSNESDQHKRSGECFLNMNVLTEQLILLKPSLSLPA